MAFTDAQKADIRRWLGYPQVNRYRNTRLEGILDLVGADPDASAIVVSILAAIAALDVQLTGSIQTAGIKRADEVEFFPGLQQKGNAVIATVRDQGRMLSSRLSQLFGVPVWGDPWGTGGYPGDWFMGAGFQYGSGGGGVMPLG